MKAILSVGLTSIHSLPEILALKKAASNPHWNVPIFTTGHDCLALKCRSAISMKSSHSLSCTLVRIALACSG